LIVIVFGFGHSSETQRFANNSESKTQRRKLFIVFLLTRLIGQIF
jgi:hypothetical protein